MVRGILNCDICGEKLTEESHAKVLTITVARNDDLYFRGHAECINTLEDSRSNDLFSDVIDKYCTIKCDARHNLFVEMAAIGKNQTQICNKGGI